MPFQALYRRYRPQKFSEVIGQSHIVSALKNAVANERVGHAYLFSGPRGTGKTSLARILAKSLNCENPDAGEPCGECASCQEFAAGTSYDLYELDAASNNGVDAMRDLISVVALAAIRNYKVYVIDEVHMLSSGAENALLKTLEEPPEYVIFVLCTTEPHKVVETVRSRTQHLEFGLVPNAELREHIKWVIEDAELSASDADIDYVLNEGGGSVRDSLSALDQVVAAGKAPERQDMAEDMVSAILKNDMKGALIAVADCIAGGMELKIMVSQAIEILRNAFLSLVGVEQNKLSDTSNSQAQAIASEHQLPRIVNVIEVLGECLAMMRSAPSQRVELEVALIKLTRTNKAEIVKAFQELQQKIDELNRKLENIDRATTDGDSPDTDVTAVDTGKEAGTDGLEVGSEDGSEDGLESGLKDAGEDEPEDAETETDMETGSVESVSSSEPEQEVHLPETEDELSGEQPEELVAGEQPMDSEEQVVEAVVEDAQNVVSEAQLEEADNEPVVEEPTTEKPIVEEPEAPTAEPLTTEAPTPEVVAGEVATPEVVADLSAAPKRTLGAIRKSAAKSSTLEEGTIEKGEVEKGRVEKGGVEKSEAKKDEPKTDASKSETAAKPVVKSEAEPKASKSANESATKSASGSKSASTTKSKAAPKAASKSAPKSALKAKATKKPAVKSKPATKSPSSSTPSSETPKSNPAAKSTAKPAAEPSAGAAKKSASKPTSKTAPKTASKSDPKPDLEPDPKPEEAESEQVAMGLDL